MFHRYKKGLAAGFLFGTAGLFALAVLSLMSPVIESLAQPFLWPGRMFSSLLTDGTGASTGMVIVLYALTGIFYAAVGALVQIIVKALQGDR